MSSIPKFRVMDAPSDRALLLMTMKEIARMGDDYGTKTEDPTRWKFFVSVAHRAGLAEECKTCAGEGRRLFSIHRGGFWSPSYSEYCDPGCLANHAHGSEECEDCVGEGVVLP
jgi:hypothetical protein